MIIKRPSVKPDSAFFSSGPCAKRPGWSISNLPTFTLGRSHRSKIAKDKLKELITLSKSLLKLPNDYKVGIVAGSDTGAIEMAMWSLLGATGVDILGWENFGNDWVKDAVSQLKIKNLNVHKADYGKLPDLTKVDFNNDVVFTWNGTSSGVCLPDADWIKDDRKGLTICDATSSVFAMPMDWKKLDVITWSWQKVLGGEGGHGMIALSPKALERLKTYQPSWPIPKIFRLAEDKKVLEGVFEGETINTPSMLCVEDCVDALLWIRSVGGSEGAIKRSKKNLEEVKFFVKENKDWIDFLAEKENTISSTSICLKITDSNFKKLSKEDQTTKLKTINQILEKENIAYDINSYRTAPAGFRIWGGATVESTDIEKLLPWIKWAYLTNLNV
jgi:phosphoserine aminotransferase